MCGWAAFNFDLQKLLSPYVKSLTMPRDYPKPASQVGAMLSTARISTRLAVSLFPMSVNSSQSHCSTTDSLREDLSCMDSIRLNGLLFHGYHGVLPEENTLGQKFRVDAILYCGKHGLQAAGRSDDLQSTVNYANTYRRIQSIVEGKPHQLIETVAERIAASMLHDHQLVRAARVHVAKPHVSLPGPLENVQVEILRWKQEVPVVDW